MVSSSFIDVIEATYNISSPDAQWLQTLTERASALIAPERSMLGYSINTCDPVNGVIIAHAYVVGEDHWLMEVQEFNNNQPPEQVNKLHFRGISNTTATMTLQSMARQTEEEFNNPWEDDPNMNAHGYKDFWTTIAINPEGRGMVLSSPLKEPTILSGAQQQTWLKLGVHIAAAVRLRHSLRRSDDPFKDADAILNPNGSPVHLTKQTSSSRAQERLHHAAQRIDKARGALRRTDPLEALDLWEGLVAGRWSLVEHIDTDARRFLLVKENEPHVTDPRKLTHRERQVVNFVVQGHHNKLIGYELGLSTSTVAHHLKKAMRKLGFGTRSELIAFFQQLVASEPGSV